MSYDLAFWAEARPITSDGAGARFVRLIEADHPTETPSMAAQELLGAVESRWPHLEGLSDRDADASPWSMSPHIHGDMVVLTIRFAAIDGVYGELRQLSAAAGLVMYDPQREVALWPPLLTDMPHLRAENEQGDIIDEPSEDHLHLLLSDLDTANSYLIIDRGGQHYMQTKIDEYGRFAVEYRDGGPDRHFRFDDADLRLTHDLLTKFAFDVPGWAEQVDWYPLDLS